MLTAKPDHRSVHQHHFDAEDVVCRQTIFKAVYSARILRDIAADRTSYLARWIRSIVEAGVLDGLVIARLVTPG